MSLSDPLADMLTRIRNGARAGHKYIVCRCSKQKIAILQILRKEGYIENYQIIENDVKQEIKVRLRFFKQESVIRKLIRISRPGRRVYVKAAEIKPFHNNFGITIISTPKGIMTGMMAKRIGVGGEVICRVL